MHFEICDRYLCRMSIRINWDAIGISASLACAVHCAVLPLIVTTLPVFGIDIIDNVVFECFMIFLALAIGTYALWHGYRKHHRRFAPQIIFYTGIVFLFAKQAWHAHQFWLLPTAVVLVISAHLLNFRLCRVHNRVHPADCDH